MPLRELRSPLRGTPQAIGTYSVRSDTKEKWNVSTFPFFWLIFWQRTGQLSKTRNCVLAGSPFSLLFFLYGPPTKWFLRSVAWWGGPKKKGKEKAISDAGPTGRRRCWAPSTEIEETDRIPQRLAHTQIKKRKKELTMGQFSESGIHPSLSLWSHMYWHTAQ